VRAKNRPVAEEGIGEMSPQNTVRDWARLLYYFGQNTISFIGAVLTTSSAITLIGF